MQLDADSLEQGRGADHFREVLEHRRGGVLAGRHVVGESIPHGSKGRLCLRQPETSFDVGKQDPKRRPQHDQRQREADAHHDAVDDGGHNRVARREGLGAANDRAIGDDQGYEDTEHLVEQRLGGLRLGLGQNAGIAIVRKALEAPLRQIAENAGVDGSVVAGKIRESEDLKFGYNAQTDTYEDMVEAADAKKYTEALRAFEEFEKEYAASSYFEKAAAKGKWKGGVGPC